MARKGIRYSQQDPNPRKGVKKDCEECQKLYKAVRHSRWVRRSRENLTKSGAMSWTEVAFYAKQEGPQTEALKAHVATHLIPTP